MLHLYPATAEAAKSDGKLLDVLLHHTISKRFEQRTEAMTRYFLLTDGRHEHDDKSCKHGNAVANSEMKEKKHKSHYVLLLFIVLIYIHRQSNLFVRGPTNGLAMSWTTALEANMTPTSMFSWMSSLCFCLSFHCSCVRWCG